MKSIKPKSQIATQAAKKSISIITILIFLISMLPLASINAIDVSAAENVCCAKSQGNFCVYTTQDKCDQSSSLKSQLGFITSPFSCNQLADCKPVCCVTENGVCKEKTSKAQCRAQGGKPIDSADCKIPECEKGACVIANQCQYPVTSTACKSQAEKLKVKYTFDVSVKSQQECSTKYSLEEGCCVSNNQCSRSTGESCTLQKGNFFPGKLCSNQELVSQCRDHSSQYSTTCNKDGNLYYTDSKGVLENVVGTANDGLIHNKQSDLQGKQGYCDLTKGFTCGKNSQGQYACIDINCKVNDVIDLRGIVQYAPEAGKMFPEKHTISQEDLGGQSSRKNGESWCYSSSGEKTEPGTSHYVFSCQYGKIKVEACGEFRDKICNEEKITSQSTTQSSARCIDNQWEDCWTYGGGKDWRRANAFYSENKVNPVKRNAIESRAGRTLLTIPVVGAGNFLPIGTKKDKQECLLLGGSEDPAKSHCVFDTNGLNECWPRYPPGFQFWKSPTEDVAAQQRVCNRCGKGGNGKQNRCDEKECSYMADCGFDEGLSWWQGALVGGGIGAAAGAGAAGIATIGGGPAAGAGGKALGIKAFAAGLAKGVLVGTTTQVVSQQALKQINTAEGKPFMMDGGAVYKDVEGNKYIDQQGSLYKIENSGPQQTPQEKKYQEDVEASKQ